jgi:hypothetical protein
VGSWLNSLVMDWFTHSIPMPVTGEPSEQPVTTKIVGHFCQLAMLGGSQWRQVCKWKMGWLGSNDACWWQLACWREMKMTMPNWKSMPACRDNLSISVWN